MKRVILIGISLAVSTVSMAQQAPQTVSVPAPLLAAIYAHLTNGGAYAAGQELARELQDAATAPQRDAAREAEIRKKIEGEAKAKSPPADPAK